MSKHNIHEQRFELEGREPTIVKAVHDKDNPYVMLNRETVIQNKELSFRARGLLAYMLNRPQGWKFNIKHLSSDKVTTKEGREAIQTAMKELRQHGYVDDEFVRNEAGVITERKLIVYEVPQGWNTQNVEQEEVNEQDASHMWE